VSGTKGDGWYVIVAGAMAALVIMRERSASAVLALLLGIIITGIGIADLNSIQSAPGPIPPTERRWNRTIQPERCSGLPDFKLSRGVSWLAGAHSGALRP